MRTILIISFILQVALVQAQNSAAHKLFDKYEDKKGFTSVLISEYAFQLLADVAEGEEEEFQEVANMITGLRILTAEGNATQSAEFAKELSKTFNFNSSSYKPLMTVKSDGEDVKFYLREENKKISEFILLVLDPESPVMILIEGENIDLNKLKKLANKTDIDMLDSLDKM